MDINQSMNLDDLAARMGGATIDEANEMRYILYRSAYNGLTTQDVPDDHWRHMCDKSVELAAE